MSRVPNQDRAEIWDLQKASDALFPAAGGMAVWTRHGETTPRACVRHAGDIEDCIIDLAALQLGLDQVLRTIAAAHGVEEDRIRAMVGVAKEHLASKVETVSRITPAGGGD